MSPQDHHNSQNGRYLRVRGVCTKIGASRSHVWNLAKYDPAFPQPIRLSRGVTVWDEREVDAWVEGKRTATVKGC
jgi:predicted DNA-binding transcriptional regulator AlpA